MTRHFDAKLLVKTYTPFNVVVKRNKRTVMMDAVCNFAKCKNCAGESSRRKYLRNDFELARRRFLVETI